MIDPYGLKLLQQASLNARQILDRQISLVQQMSPQIGSALQSVYATDFNSVLTQISESNRLLDLVKEKSAVQQSQMKQILASSAERQSQIKQILASSDKFSVLGKYDSGLMEAIRGVGLQSRFNAIDCIAKSFELASLAQASIARLDLLAQTKSSLLSTSIPDSFFRKSFDFSRAYSNLSTELEEIIEEQPASVKIVSELPAIEVLNNVDVLELVSIPVTEDESEVEEESIKGGFFPELEKIEKFLISIGYEDLVPMWQGANYALSTQNDNPDYVRHCVVSLRELLTQIIHRLAPDKDINTWTSDKQLFHNGKPTRKARLLFLSRSINHDTFTEFIKKDIDALVEFFQLFQRGTHEPTIPFTHKQLLALKARVECTINFLIEVWHLNN